MGQFCEHVILSSLPLPGAKTYKGFEVCPYCGSTAPMFTRFQKTGAGDGAKPRPHGHRGHRETSTE